jgi:putative ATP-binding cassette transporter
MYLTALRMLIPAIKIQKKNSVIVLGTILAIIGLSVALNEWRGSFYSAIQIYDTKHIWSGIVEFIVLALACVFVYGISSFYQRYLEFGVREYLYNKYSKGHKEVPNADQRLQDDSLKWAKTSLALLRALIDAGVRLPVFLFILATIAKPWMVGIVIVYAALGTLGSRKVARPLVDLEFQQEQKEAELRRGLITAIETKDKYPLLTEVKLNWEKLAIRNKYLAYYTQFYSQISVIFPFIMLLPMYLSHAILLGILMQSSSAIEEVLKSMSIFVESRDLIIDLQMQTRRLSELETGDLE